MFAWLGRLRTAAAERLLASLEAENRALHAEWRRLHGSEPVPLTPRERQRLRELRDRIDPQRRKALAIDDDIFRLEEE